MGKRTMERLSAVGVKRLTAQGMYADGGGLYLSIKGTGRSWVFRYRDRTSGKLRDMGLGATHTVSLADARAKARDQRALLLAGADPLSIKREAALSRKLEAARSMTFDQCALAYVSAHRAKWRNAKHADQWTNTLRDYASPVFGGLPVAAVDTGLVRKALEPIWTAKHETATRVRQRIESVLSWATVAGYRSGENPARWKGHLDKLLPAIPKAERVTHHPALDWRLAGVFMTDLRERDGIAARALEFLILTAARTGEIIGATWGEIDVAGKRWAIPGSRMKAKRTHVVALSERALEILAALPQGEPTDQVFGGPKGPLSNMAMTALLKRMGRERITVHGFRSMFRTWAGEATAYPREVIEMALAHSVGNATEQAYSRGDLFEKRARLMQEWSDYLDRAEPATVTAIRTA